VRSSAGQQRGGGPFSRMVECGETGDVWMARLGNDQTRRRRTCLVGYSERDVAAAGQPMPGSGADLIHGNGKQTWPESSAAAALMAAKCMWMMRRVGLLGRRESTWASNPGAGPFTHHALPVQLRRALGRERRRSTSTLPPARPS
jgi:hypothetical protein